MTSSSRNEQLCSTSIRSVINDNIQVLGNHTQTINQNIINDLKISENKIELKTLHFNMIRTPNSFIGRDKVIDDVLELLLSNKTVAITGLGGVGKTELARAFAWRFYQEKQFDNIAWMNSETTDELTNSIKNLAAELDIDVKNRLTNEILQSVFECCVDNSLLMVFDNVSTVRFIRNYFPIDNQNIRVFILITSQLSEWGDIECYKLNVLSEEEGVQLVVNQLNKCFDIETSQEAIKELVKTLEYLPLALQQASAFIKDKKIYENDLYSVEQYLDSFEKILFDTELESPFPDYSDNPYTKTVYKTMMMAIEKIRKTNSALEIFSYIAYLNPNEISLDLFVGIKDLHKETVNAGVRELKKYSLVSEKSREGWDENVELIKYRSLHVHRLVQQIWRSFSMKSSEHTHITNILKILVDNPIHESHLIFALQHSNEQIIYEYYINNPGDYNPIQTSHVHCQFSNMADWQALHYAAYYIHKRVFECLINKGADVNYKSTDGWTPLHIATTNNHWIVEQLIQAKADFNAKTNQGYTPLHLAVIMGYGFTVKLFLKMGADINARTVQGFTPLYLAVEQGNERMVDELLNKQADPNVKTKDGQMALHLAAEKGFGWEVCHLIKAGVDVNIQDTCGLTPIQVAKKHRRLKTIKLFNLATKMRQVYLVDNYLWNLLFHQEILSHKDEYIDVDTVWTYKN